MSYNDIEENIIITVHLMCHAIVAYSVLTDNLANYVMHFY